jgi:hypothetical protein
MDVINKGNAKGLMMGKTKLILLAVIPILAGIFGCGIAIYSGASAAITEISQGNMSGVFHLLLSFIPFIVIFIVFMSIKGMIFPLLKASSLSSKLKASGVKSVGFIKSLQQTGVYINNQPQLNIQLEVLNARGEKFMTSLKTVVSLTALSSVKEGVPLSIIYDPVTLECVIDDQPDSAAIQEIVARYQAAHEVGGLSYEERMALYKQGVETPVIIKDLQITGAQRDNKYEMNLTIEFPADALGNKKLASRTLYCSQEQYSQFQIGKVITVSVVPGHENRFGLVTNVVQGNI